jgi:FtsH-binding integral membrane protein
MFIGHFGIGLGAKKLAPSVSLGTLFLAAQFLDLLWPSFLLLGWEHVKIQPGISKMTPLNFTDYPISHSLLMAVVWGLLLGLVYFLIKRKYKAAIIVGLAVLSHWFLDYLVHIPDLPLYPGSSIDLGLGIWNYKLASILLEGFFFIGGTILYLRATRAKNKTGKIAFWALIIFLVLIYISNLTGSAPPSVKAIAWAGQLQWLFVIWAYWVDKNRIVRKAAA